MNSTIWNPTEVASLHIILVVVTAIVHGYAIFLCYAIHDYQDEKPTEEKSPIDVLIKDLMNSNIVLLCYSFLVHLISLSIPPSTSINAYMISHIGIFITNFHSNSMLVLMCTQHAYVFYPDQFSKINVLTMRWKSLVWKFILTILSLALDFLVPSKEIPIPFQLLSKGKHYDR